MILRPCLDCGLPSDATRCAEHEAERARRRERGRTRTDEHRSRSRSWRALSALLREASPFCERCGSTDDLTVDHVVPLSLGGEELHGPMRVLCRPCHGRAWAEQYAAR